MRLAAAAAVVLSACAIASAQLSNIPQCSLKCLTSALGADGCSELTDFACHCQKTGLVEQVVPCVKKDCDVADQQAVSKVVVSLCSGAGHPVSLPPVDSSAPTTTAAGHVPTTSSSSNSTTVSSISGIGKGPLPWTTAPRTTALGSATSTTGSAASTMGSATSSTANTNAASASSTDIPLSNGASGLGLGSGAAQVAGAAVLLASMMVL